MAVHEGTHEAILPAAPEAAFAAMTDYERLPQWQRPLRRCTVLSRRDDGLARDVEYEVDVKLRTVAYRLRHDYEPPRRIESEYLGGDFACFEGRWRFEPAGAGRTAATLAVRIDPGFPVPGPIARMIRSRVLESSVTDLRKHLEEA